MHINDTNYIRDNRWDSTGTVWLCYDVHLGEAYAKDHAAKD
jgi:hypothetical protein